jgi:8-oxo-dGTP diphosphatase
MPPEDAAAPAQPVRAAGGVVWRRDGDAGGARPVLVLLVHRPRYDDWSLPKGKADAGESDEECALREVREETGLTCRLGRELPSTRYRDNRSRDKVVRYWAMEPVGDDGFTPNAEIDELRWLPLPEALRLLSYDHDRPVVRGLPPPLAG